MPYSEAIKDITDSIKRYYLWGRMGWSDMRGKYRRTTLGPFWATVSLGVFVFMLGQIWSRLWGKDIDSFMPYVAAGFVSWNLISSMITGGVNCFIGYKRLINSIKFPLPMIPLAVIWNNLALFFHNILVVIIVDIVYTVNFNPLAHILILVGLLLIWLNGIWVMILLGILGARYRDIHIIVTTILQMMFFLTPIIWTTERLGDRINPIFVQLNPLLHYVEVIRQPMLGNIPSLTNFIVVVIITVIGWICMLMLYQRYKNRIVFWI